MRLPRFTSPNCIPPNTAATRSNLNRPTRPQLSPPTIVRIAAAALSFLMDLLLLYRVCLGPVETMPALQPVVKSLYRDRRLLVQYGCERAAELPAHAGCRCGLPSDRSAGQTHRGQSGAAPGMGAAVRAPPADTDCGRLPALQRRRRSQGAVHAGPCVGRTGRRPGGPPR